LLRLVQVAEDVQDQQLALMAAAVAVLGIKIIILSLPEIHIPLL
jgi:hypothetical protein